jgi:hypothetical protein
MPRVRWFKGAQLNRFVRSKTLNLSRSVFLLFALNIVDALVTIFWIRYGITTEGNYLMATVLDYGEAPFFAIKLGMGLVTAGVLLYGAQYRLAQIGARLGLIAYSFAIASHILTGFAAKGYLS